LTITTDALVTRVVFDGRRATGVEIDRATLAASSRRAAKSSSRAAPTAHRSCCSSRVKAMPLPCNRWVSHRCSICPRSAEICRITPPHRLSVRTDNTESYGLSWRTVPRSVLIAAQYMLFRFRPLASNVSRPMLHAIEADLDRPDLQIIFVPRIAMPTALAAARARLWHHFS